MTPEIVTGGLIVMAASVAGFVLGKTIGESRVEKKYIEKFLFFQKSVNEYKDSLEKLKKEVEESIKESEESPINEKYAVEFNNKDSVEKFEEELDKLKRSGAKFENIDIKALVKKCGGRVLGEGKEADKIKEEIEAPKISKNITEDKINQQLSRLNRYL